MKRLLLLLVAAACGNPSASVNGVTQDPQLWWSATGEPPAEVKVSTLTTPAVITGRVLDEKGNGADGLIMGAEVGPTKPRILAGAWPEKSSYGKCDSLGRYSIKVDISGDCHVAPDFHGSTAPFHRAISYPHSFSCFLSDPYYEIQIRSSGIYGLPDLRFSGGGILNAVPSNLKKATEFDVSSDNDGSSESTKEQFDGGVSEWMPGGRYTVTFVGVKKTIRVRPGDVLHVKF